MLEIPQHADYYYESSHKILHENYINKETCLPFTEMVGAVT